jgi:hypothetical protein
MQQDKNTNDLIVHAIDELWLVAYWKRQLKQEHNGANQKHIDHFHIDRPPVPFW